MAKKSFFSTEPLFFKFVYIIGFIGVFYVLYENILHVEEKNSRLILYVLVIFGLFNLRKYNTNKNKNSQHLPKKKVK
jgi:hypothetical protein